MSSKKSKPAPKTERSKTDKEKKSGETKSKQISKSKNSSSSQSNRSNSSSKSKSQDSKSVSIKNQQSSGLLKKDKTESKPDINAKRKDEKTKASNNRKQTNSNQSSDNQKKGKNSPTPKTQNREKPNSVSNIPKSPSKDSSISNNKDKPAKTKTPISTPITKQPEVAKNPPKSTEDSNNGNKNPVLYENLIFDILKKFPDGISIDKLVVEAGDKILNKKGPFKNLPPKRRMKAILIILKSQKKVETTSNDLWKFIDNKSSFELFSLSENNGKVSQPNLLQLINATKKE